MAWARRLEAAAAGHRRPTAAAHHALNAILTTAQNFIEIRRLFATAAAGLPPQALDPTGRRRCRRRLYRRRRLDYSRASLTASYWFDHFRKTQRNRPHKWRPTRLSRRNSVWL